MKKKITFKGLWEILKNSFSGFLDDNTTTLSASLAYYTVFSLGPLMIVIIFLCSIFLGREAIEGTIYDQLKGFVGKDAADTLQGIIKSAAVSGKGTVSAIIGVITLLVGATTVFAEIQSSINTIWGLKAKADAGWLQMVKKRLLSFGIIGSLGFLLLVSLGITALIEALSGRLKALLPGVSVAILYVVNLVISFGVISALFGVIFKVLPDAKIKWKDVIAGAIATGVLFMIGKFGISLYIAKMNVGSTYGAAGSLVILLVWVYYSAMILYFGAEFTKAYAIKYGGEIHPDDYAVVTKKVEVEDGKKSIQQNEKEANDIKEGKAPVAALTPKPPKPLPYYDVPKPEKKDRPGVFSILQGLVVVFIYQLFRPKNQNKGIQKGNR